ncbi:hypothetical protein [Azospirillum sp. TSO35-2]|uniref:hypothetical protein n=1 Tax=Azospirillum sp. TSO35-2 TaxID=716796 RepID=UPI000D60F40C|nr:hypothetical protein [Azospirillum sp. TSO35-2]PWC39674.1 hypothetical protein TSO352_06070 [Azospirillum sp. TSO35-2]
MDHRRSPLRPLVPLLAAGAVLTLAACSHYTEIGGVPAAEVATQPPVELVGLTVQPPDGSRILGNVSDLVIGPGNRVEQAIVTSGAPMYPTEHRVTVNSANLRYAKERQAVILVGMTPDQFTALPVVAADNRMLSLGNGTTLPASAANGPAPTNWSGATRPR